MQKEDVERISRGLELLKLVLVPFRSADIIRLSGRDNTYRMRIGRYRIVYQIYPKEQIARVMRIEIRKDNTYKGL